MKTSLTLFIDRDGVINKEKNNDYIYNWQEFQFYENALEALKILSTIFTTIVIVTNQKGVGKGLMSIDDLMDINSNLINTVNSNNGHINKVYFCTDIDNDSPNRKPNIGMALQAKKDFPKIDFEKSVMIGNAKTDMEFGRNAGIKINIFLKTTKAEQGNDELLVDYSYDNLYEAAVWLSNNYKMLI